MIDRGLQAERLQGAVAADPEHDFLFEAHLGSAAVELVGDVAVFGPVLDYIGVQQVERNAAHHRAPDLGRDLVVSQLHGKRAPVGAALQRDRQVLKVVVLIRFLLPAGGVKVLAKVALLIKQPDAHQGHAQVAGGLQMIAGQHAQAPGENRQAFGDAEFGRKVGNQQALVLPAGAPVPARFAGQIRSQRDLRVVQIGEKGLIAGGGFQLRLADQPQHPHRVVAGGFPEIAIQPAEQLDGVVIPAPPQIVRQRAQPFERGG